MKYPSFRSVKQEMLRMRSTLHPKQLEFGRDFYNIITGPKDEKVLVFPARCGIGKSTITKSILVTFAKKNIGIIIITDSNDRLDELLEYSDEETKELMLDKVEDFRGKDSFSRHIENGIHKPVALITTQKYFRLDKQYLEKLFLYKPNKKNVGRNIVIFDEKPYFCENPIINIKTVNDINSAIHEGIGDEVPDKDWALSQVDKLAQNIRKQLIILEQESKESSMFFTRIRLDGFGEAEAFLTADDNRFFKFIQANKDKLFEYDMSAYHNILATKQLLTEGGIFQSSKNKDGETYKKSFTVHMPKKDYFYESRGKVKFFVLDATANIDPVYNVDYVKIVDCSKYNIPINLELNLVDVSTSKTGLKKASDDYWAMCQKHISMITNCEETLVVTYKDCIDKLCSGMPQFKRAHFGNLKGSNKFNYLTNMVQYGLNRAPPLTYFFTLCTVEPTLYETIKEESVEESKNTFDIINQRNSMAVYMLQKSKSEASDNRKTKNTIEPTINPSKDKEKFKYSIDITKINKDTLEYHLHEVTRMSILADFVQNMYRISIRNWQNTKKNKIWLFYKHDMPEFKSQYIEQLIEHGQIIHKVNYLEQPVEFWKFIGQKRKTSDGHRTVLQKILTWSSEQEDGRIFTLEYLAKETGLTKKQIDNAKTRNPNLKKMFKKLKIKKGIYCIKS